MGSIINDSNSIEEEIKDRIALGNKAYHANQKFFKSRLVTMYSKLHLYGTVIRPLVDLRLGNMGTERNHNSETVSL